MTYHSRSARRADTRSAFTLVELLVVIGIIALLISILLPTLSQARKSAKALVCLSNQRSIGQGVALYASDWDNYIPGSNLTSSIMIFADPEIGQDNLPNRIGMFDYMTPIAEVMGIEFNTGPTVDDRSERFEQLKEPGSIFHCPENQQLTTAFTGGGGADIGAQIAVSYSTAVLFLYRPNGTGPIPNDNNQGLNRRAYPQFYSMEQGYIPKINKVGNSSAKVYLGDGARYSRGDFFPTYNLDYNGSTGGTFATWGAFSPFSHAMHREGVPGNEGQGSAAGNDEYDTRQLWARHGVGRDFGPSGSFTTNLLFFDGHAERLNDLEASNPAFWGPPGTGLDVDNDIWNDTRAFFLGDNPPLNSSGEWVIP